MKQNLQNLHTGETKLVEVPCPQVKPGHLLSRSRVSLISSGTERSLVAFGQANLWNKARQQPEQMRMVSEELKSDGLLSTWETVRNKLDQPFRLGYSNAGSVLAVGEGVEGFTVAARVVSNDRHAEAVLVPKNLRARIPDAVDDTSAAFTVASPRKAAVHVLAGLRR